MRAGPSVFLVGFMGSGKSAVGRRLAERIRWEFVDGDGRVEAREGRSIARIFAESGEAHFRAVERQLLAELADGSGQVVATGGGAFLDPLTRRRLNRGGRTVWLDAPLEVCRARVGDDASRPLWRGNDPLGLRLLFERRRATYALACHRIDAAGGVEGVVEAILSGSASIWR